MILDILGSKWTFEYRTEKKDPRLENCDGYTDWTTRLIVVEQEIEGDLGDMRRYAAKVARHEIVHAFLVESGLSTSSGCYDSWATNEEMVDWIARIGPRIYHAWTTANVLLPEDFGG